MTGILGRRYDKNQTFGKLYILKDDECIFHCNTLELKWMGNIKNISCIPEGHYHVEKMVRPNGKPGLWIKDVPKRTAILIHLGNFAVAGRPYGVIYGSAIARDANGNRIVDFNGSYLATEDVQEIGDPNADFRSTLINEFAYKNFSLQFQLEYTHGGDMYSTTASALISRGLTKDTDFDRSQTFVLPGVLPNGNINNVQIPAAQWGFENNGFVIDEQAIYDATHLRLREVSLSYDFPKKMIERTPFGKISISFIGQNLWFKAFNLPKYVNFDPEVSSLGVGNGQGFDYLTGPTAKRYGFNLNLTF